MEDTRQRPGRCFPRMLHPLPGPVYGSANPFPSHHLNSGNIKPHLSSSLWCSPQLCRSSGPSAVLHNAFNPRATAYPSNLPRKNHTALYVPFPPNFSSCTSDANIQHQQPTPQTHEDESYIPTGNGIALYAASTNPPNLLAWPLLPLSPRSSFTLTATAHPRPSYLLRTH